MINKRGRNQRFFQCNFFPKNRRGQFYLIAAIVIIAIIIGFVAVSNYLEKKEFTKVYDLGEELKIESAQVLDYGIYNELDEVDMTNLLMGFIEEYSEYGEIEKLYFIFGNVEKIVVVGYQQLAGEILVNVGTEDCLLIISEGTPTSKKFYPSTNKVIITVSGIEYEFTLKQGENFYFILVITEEGEQYVVTN